MNFSRFLDIQSWWEVPSIAYFCSLFRTAFNLLDFDIEELEEALLTDGTEESASSLLTELIVRLLNGCLGNNDVSAFNYQMYLRRLFRRKCQETSRYNPFNTDIDFQFLPLRTKVEILHALCDFRLDAEDVFDLFKNLEAESLRVEPLGWDDNDSAYWYFYGTRLYREDLLRKPKAKAKKKKSKESRKRGWFYGDDWLDDDETERVWQVVCFTEDDWAHLTEKFSKATSKVEKELYRSLSQNFLPEIPRLFQEKERLQRKRLLELPRRTSSRVLKKSKQKEEGKPISHDAKQDSNKNDTTVLSRDNRAKRRNLLRSKSVSSDVSANTENNTEEMPQKVTKRAKSQEKKPKNSSTSQKGEPPPEPPIKPGRKTNNSLASATGQILIPDNDEPQNSTRKKLKTSQIFSQSEEDIQTDMYKVLEQLTAHEDAWPFMDPVEEEYAPNYYAVIRRPMDLRKMEERLDSGYYTDFAMFKADFKLIVNNCRLYNGQDNEYTMMVDNLQTAFDRLTEKYMHRLSSSDEEIAVEYQIPTPSRKHKLKSSESPTHHKRKKRRSHSDSGEAKSSTSDTNQEVKKEESAPESEEPKIKESHKNKEGKIKKKRKGHHRHGKHSKNHKKESRKSEHGESKSKHSKKQKHSKNKNKEGKKIKQKKKKNKHHDSENNEVLKRTVSQESIESSNRSRSASPLPSIHSPTPSPQEVEQVENAEQLTDPDFFKDKYDKIKERRRNAAKDAFESLLDYKQKNVSEKQKQNLNMPEKDKNQKLTETIEKLKAKNEKFKEDSTFNSLFSANGEDSKDGNTKESPNNEETEETEQKKKPKKGNKKNAAKNESASEALEQAVKDISKWFEDAPKNSSVSSPSDSPAPTIPTEEQENRIDDELSQGDKPSHSRRELIRKRPSSREPKLLKRREIQRTIERLQPGKSKGNLLTNIPNKVEKVEDPISTGPLTKVRELNKTEETSPKLSLGSVLPTVDIGTIGSDHNFGNKDETPDEDPNNSSKLQEPISQSDELKDDTSNEKATETVSVQTTKKDAEVETDPTTIMKPNQEKATPNLSAWFKAFGAPKSAPPSHAAVKKKTEETDPEEKPESTNVENKVLSPKHGMKYDSPVCPETPNPEGGESPHPGTNVTPRQRRTSTGSSMSERSSFSQDLDSPRHQMSHTSPLLHSPASPRTEDFQKISYPIINGTVRAGFYHDTTSLKSSPEKSCSPREGPQSPYSPYSQHVYASNNATGSATPHYFVDHSKSPLPAYNHNPPPFYDTSKAPVVSKPPRVHDDYTSLGPETYQQSQYTGPFSPAYTPYAQVSASNYTHSQHSPQTAIANTNMSSPAPPPPPPPVVTEKTTTASFPVKKRTYSEIDQTPPAQINNVAKTIENKEVVAPAVTKVEVQKPLQTTHTTNSMSSTSVDDIALALSEKSEIAKLNNLRDKPAMEYHRVEERDPKYEMRDSAPKQDVSGLDLKKPSTVATKDNIDMVNMGYLNPENDRRNNVEHRDAIPVPVVRENVKANVKPQHIEPIAINLGMNNQSVPKPQNLNSNPNNIPPAHSQERAHPDLGINQIMAHAHHTQYDTMASAQAIGGFSMNDIELANKKLYGCNTTPSNAAIDYGNWKISNQIRKQDLLPSDYSASYVQNADKHKNDTSQSTTSINYSKNIQNHQYNTYNTPRNSTQRTSEMPQNNTSELRIPNPRGLLKNDHLNMSSSAAETEITLKNVENHAKVQKPEKLVQNHPLVTSNPYKPPYSTHSSIPLETLRTLPNIPQMLERYTNDERYLSTFAGSTSSLYHEKQFQMAQMFNKSMSAAEMHHSNSPVSLAYSQSSIPNATKDNGIYKPPTLTTQAEVRPKTKRRRVQESKAPVVGNQTYHHTPSCSADVLSSVKPSMIPSSAFNFGSSTNMALGTSLYSDNSGFSIEDFRNSTANQLMAANYMVAAVAHQQRNNAETNAEKLVKPAHQNSTHTSSSFPFIGHSQVRAGYPFVGDPSSPLYQQYLQRHQEELLRQTGAQIMSLYPGGYPAGLGVRQPYDSINRPSWL